MNFDNHFTIGDKRRIRKVLSVMEELAQTDPFFSVAVKQFEAATGAEKIIMGNYLLKIFYAPTKCSGMTLEQAVILSAYPA